MTREEAIKVLNTYDVNFYEYRAEEIADAIDMATKALKAEPTGVLISRQAAVDAVESIKRTDNWQAAVIVALHEVPSAEPVHGEWVQISPARIYECSKCGQNVMTDDIEAYKFCHGCGAKMGGEINEEQR